VSETRLVPSESGGLVPERDGWFVLNARDARWLDGDLGKYCAFEGSETRFPQLGINLNLLRPGEPMTMYHRENAQEDFLVLAGECLLVVEGEERSLVRWDLFHCPAGVAHAIVGAGQGRSLVLAVGARVGGDEDDRLLYPADPAAQRRGAGVPTETSSPEEAYARFSFAWRGYAEGWLPE
jgi:uncharacterized cupin superfamily protein